jgi:hypothetical protein
MHLAVIICPDAINRIDIGAFPQLEQLLVLIDPF